MADVLHCQPEPASVRAARRFVVDTLQTWGLDDLVDSAALLTSELVTNAILHTRRPFDVDVVRQPSGIRVEVIDGSEEPPSLPPPPSTATVSARAVAGDVLSPPSVDADRVFSGLGMVDAVATDWGIQPRPGHGKAVWFELRSHAQHHYTGLRSLRDDTVDLRQFEEPTQLPGLEEAHSPVVLRTVLIVLFVALLGLGLWAILWAGGVLGAVWYGH